MFRSVGGEVWSRVGVGKKGQIVQSRKDGDTEKE